MSKFIIECSKNNLYTCSYIGELTTGSHEEKSFEESVLDLIRIFEKRFKFIKFHKGECGYDILKSSMDEIKSLNLESVHVELIGVDFNRLDYIKEYLKSKLSDFLNEIHEYESCCRL